MKAKKKAAEIAEPAPLLKLDFGCGPNPREGFEGVDAIDFGQKFRFDIGKSKWPWPDGSVIEANASHFIEHLNAQERAHFVNELYRVLAPGGKCSISVPGWSSERAYGDLTHQWPPVVGMWFQYLSKAWRDSQAPHTNALYTCDFVNVTGGYNFDQHTASRNPEYQTFAARYFKEAVQDMFATLVKA